MNRIIINFYSKSSWIKCCTVMTMKFILISNLLIVFAYNIDTNHPILYPNSATNADEYLHTRFEGSYFGYSVLLHHDSKKNSSWLLVGAPRGNYTRPSRDRMHLKFLNEPGVVYRCHLPGLCVEIEPAIIKDEEIYIQQLDMRGRIKKRQSWFGGAMSVERSSGFLTICAPRTIMNIVLKSDTYVTMQGMCYSGQILSTKLYAELFAIHRFDFSKNVWFDPIHGFSVTFITPRGEEAIDRIVGSPNDDIIGSINIARFKRRNFLETYMQTMNIPKNDNLSQFGFAVTSGYYFDRNRSLYACADPGWDYVGQVAIINPEKNSMITRLWGTDIGEFFGASLATGDLNKDGLHDLVIGAPHWGNDNGRVHVYLGSPKGEFEAVAILEGASEDALFGYAVASGDLDGDGFNDIIVGAPWEESGVIYIYNGDASLKDKVRPLMSQRIMMQSHHNFPVNIQTFGFSISEPIDIDNNRYADVAIGAYKSGHVVVLRSKPVVRTNLTIYTVPSTLQRNISDFFITVCVDYHGYDMANTRAFKISLIVDKRYKRTKKTLLELFSTDPPIHMCVNTSVTLSDNIQDFIEPIAIHATHDFTYNDSSAREFCKVCPVERKDSKSKSSQTLLLPFDIGCGEDRVCNSNISATVKFQRVRENNSWVIGSNDITLEIHLDNQAEPAYLTIIVFTLPEGIVLRSILPFCEEDTDGDRLMVICNVDNPLEMNEQKVVKLDLDMRHLTDSSLHGHILEFSTEIRTRSVNHGIRMIKSWLTLHSEASLLLNGKAVEKSYYLPNLDKDQLNITFQHTYQILKFGATSIDEARLTVNVPTATEDTDSLVFLYKPRIHISGKYYNCLSNGINVVNVQQNRLQKETVSDLYAYNLSNNNETLHMFKRDVIDRAIITAHILQTFYNAKKIKSEVSNGNLTVRESNIVYLNCSTYGVTCSTVYCDLSALKTRQDVGKFTMRLILNATKLKDNLILSDETKIVKFSTDAHVEIIRPVNRISDVDAKRNINLTTEFRNTAKMQKLQLWVVLVSVSSGLILLYIVIIILSLMGFFKRMTKEELSALETNEITEDVNKPEITNTE